MFSCSVWERDGDEVVAPAVKEAVHCAMFVGVCCRVLQSVVVPVVVVPVCMAYSVALAVTEDAQCVMYVAVCCSVLLCIAACVAYSVAPAVTEAVHCVIFSQCVVVS